MAVTHAHTATGTDAGTGEVHKAEWNADHIGSPLLAEMAYKNGSDAAIGATSSSTLGDVDATNAKITFTAPASGHVLVTISSLAGGTGGGYLGLRESTTQVGTQAYLGSVVGTSTLRCVAHFDITGVSAGSHTYKAAFKATSGTLSVFGGPTFGDFVMTVVDAG